MRSVKARREVPCSSEELFSRTEGLRKSIKWDETNTTQFFHQQSPSPSPHEGQRISFTAKSPPLPETRDFKVLLSRHPTHGRHVPLIGCDPTFQNDGGSFCDRSDAPIFCPLSACRPKNTGLISDLSLNGVRLFRPNSFWILYLGICTVATQIFQQIRCP